MSMFLIQVYNNLFPVPSKPWTDISIDFIEGMSTSNHENFILVVVNRFSKYAHFIALYHPFTAQEVVTIYFSQMHKLHGLPESIINDKDSLFFSHF